MRETLPFRAKIRWDYILSELDNEKVIEDLRSYTLPLIEKIYLQVAQSLPPKNGKANGRTRKKAILAADLGYEDEGDHEEDGRYEEGDADEGWAIP